MPIEFRCTQCNKLLRTADGTAGKQAKCPECGAVVSVPPPQAERPSPPPPPAGSPFGSAGPQPAPGFDPENPYQAPTATITPSAQVPPQLGAFAPTVIDFNDVFSRTWAIFKISWGMCLVVLIVVWLINFGVNIAVGIATGIAGAVAQDPAIGMMLSLLGNLLTTLFSMWIGIGQALFFLKTARGQDAALGDIFSGGPYFLSVLGASILFFLVCAGVVVVCIAPGLLLLALEADAPIVVLVLVPGGITAAVIVAVIALMFSQYYYLILDRNLGPVDSLSVSKEITYGNKATIFLIGMVAGLVGAVLVLMTCGLGLLAVAPYMALLYPVIYLAITGQRTADQMLPGQAIA